MRFNYRNSIVRFYLFMFLYAILLYMTLLIDLFII
jgi:hypothetical protein